MGEVWSIEVWVKLPGYLALVGGVGAAVALALAGAPASAALRARVIGIARIAGVVAVAGTGLRALAHAAAFDGLAGAFDLDTLRLVVVESRWGGAWRWHAVAAVAVAVTSARLAGGRRRIPYAAALAAAVVVAPWLGHGAGSVWRGALHSLHLAATGAWLGTVGVLAVSARGASPAVLASTLTPIVRRFSPWALAGAATAFASGAVLAWTYLGGVAALVDSTYGRLLLVKLAVVAAIGGCGFVNWRGVARGDSPRVRLIQVEAALAALAVAITAWLSETEHP